jgi:type IV pilus assembly protein PilN
MENGRGSGGPALVNMRLDINLASQPYEDAREFWMRWGTALVAVSLFTLILLALCGSGWYVARHDRATIAEKKQRIAARDAERKQDEEFLSLPGNRSTRDDSQFLNELIERKSFSWTEVLENLEKVMPAGAHLSSIHPELDEDNQLTMKMTVAGNSRDRGLELVRRMEDSHYFAQTNIASEHIDTAGGAVLFNIDTTYVPQLSVAKARPATSAAPVPAPATPKAPTPKRGKS